MKWIIDTAVLSMTVLAVGGGIVDPSRVMGPAARHSDSMAKIERIRVPRGTEFVATLNQRLTTEHNRAGDRFTATLEHAITDQRVVLVPAGATIHGEIAYAGSRSGGGNELSVGVSSITVDGHNYPVVATIIEARSRNDGPSTGSTVAKIGGGALIGAVLGGVISHESEGVLIGAVAGGVVGTVIASSADSHVVIDRGTFLRVRLDEDLVIRRRGTTTP